MSLKQHTILKKQQPVNLQGKLGVINPKSQVKKVFQMFKGGISVVKCCCILSEMQTEN